MSTEQYLDGLKYSKWRPEYKDNNIIVFNNNLNTNVKYRHFLMNNSEKIKEQNFNIDYGECINSKPLTKTTSNTTPYIYVNPCLDEQYISYSNSDLKQNYYENYDKKCKMQVIRF